MDVHIIKGVGVTFILGGTLIPNSIVSKDGLISEGIFNLVPLS